MTKSQFRTKTDEAYHRLRQMIEDGQFSSGQKVTELGAAKMLGIGHTSVRQAMFRLEGKGLLHGRHERQGRYVRDVEDADPEEVLLRYEAREAVESHAARLAARNMSRQQIDQLLALARRVEAGWQKADNDARGQAKRAFLDFMVANCGNVFVYRIWREHGLWPYAHRSRQVAEQVWAQLDRNRGDYSVSLAEAIAAGDQDEADRIARQGIRQIAEILRSILMGSQGDVSTLLAGAGATTDQQTDSSSPS